MTGTGEEEIQIPHSENDRILRWLSQADDVNFYFVPVRP